MKKELKTRNYCFTIHNYAKKDLGQFHKLAQELKKHRYICYGLEIAPKEKTEHIQGYIELNQAQRFTFLHNYFNFKKKGTKETLKFHVEPANGTAEQNKKYTGKEGTFFEFGEASSQGTRSDMKEIKKRMQENPKNIKEVIDELGNNLQQVRFAQILQPLYLPHRDPKNPPTVLWIYGASGVGKTKLVYDTFDDVCAVSSYDWLGTGYNQNECFLLDDFREFNLKFEEVLRLTDRYPFMLYFKGSQIPLNSPYIIFTSPKSIDEMFRETAKSEDMKQLKRRLIEIDLDFNDPNEIDLRNLDEKFTDKDNRRI